MNKALQYAFCLLKFRPRSEYEMRQRLKKKGFCESEIKETLIFLKQKRFIDDLRFAKAWVESRAKKPLGIKRLKQELRIKGVKKELINQAVEELGDKYNEEDVIKELVRRRWERLGNIEPAKARRRIFAYLVRRGFSQDVILEEINSIIRGYENRPSAG
jgi:regulatory protein